MFEWRRAIVGKVSRLTCWVRVLLGVVTTMQVGDRIIRVFILDEKVHCSGLIPTVLCVFVPYAQRKIVGRLLMISMADDDLNTVLGSFW